MRRHVIMIIILACFSVFSLRFIFHPGFMYSHDSLWHVERLQNMSALLPSQFPVRWSPNLDHDYGLPLFNYIYPAPYYLGAGFMALGLGPLKSYNLLLFLGYFVGGVGVYLLGRRRPIFGLFAALLYLLTPYQFLDIFVRGALGEVIALGLVPWIFLSIRSLESGGKLRWYSSIPFALLILSHNFYGYLFGVLLGFFTLVLYTHKRQIIISLCLSLGLASFFLLPAFFEKSYLLFTQIDHFSYRDHFVYPLQLIYGSWNYLGSLPGQDQREMSFQLGLANWAIVIVSALVTLRLYRRPTRLIWYFWAIVFSIFMMLPVSDFLWRSLPMISQVQFPWRLLGIITALLPLLYLELVDYFVKVNKSRILVIFSVFLVVLAQYNIWNYGRPLKWLNSEEFLSLHYEYVGQTATANRSEITPRWAPVERYQPEDGNPIRVIGDAQLTDIVESPLRLSFTADSPNDHSQIIWYRNYFPSWSATADNQSISLSPTKSGEIILTLLPGEHQYTIRIQSTYIERLGNLLTIFSLIILLALAYKTKKPKRLPRLIPVETI